MVTWKIHSFILISIIVVVELLYAESGETTRYMQIDKYAINTPQEYEKSIDSLVEYLIAPARNEREKLRSIYAWITNNISYNSQMLHSKYPQSLLDPESVFRSRSTVCAGYAKLAQAMMSKALGREVYYISGKLQNYLDTGQGHAWNAVKLENDWYFIDCTWGAGTLDNKENFHKRFNDFYFLMTPEISIYTHFPNDALWQRLPTPVTWNEFTNLIEVFPSFFENNLSLLSHSKSFLQADSILVIELIAPENIVLTADLQIENRVLNEKFIFIQKRDMLFDIQAAFPKKGRYNLNIYAKEKDDPSSYGQVMRYKIDVTNIKNGLIGLPYAWSAFQINNAELLSPLSGFIESKDETLYKIKVPHAIEVKLYSGKKKIKLEKDQDGDTFWTTKKLKSGDVTLYAKFPGNKSLIGLVKFTVVDF